MKKVLKWVLITLGGIVGLAVLFVAGIFGYINYQAPKTTEQKDSLQQIQDLKGPVRPGNFSEEYGDLPNVEPEIYDDRHLDDEGATPEEETQE